MTDTKLLGEYEGKPVYKSDGSDSRIRGPINGPETAYVGLVFWNPDGTMTLPDGSPFNPFFPKYETKAYIINSETIEEAIEKIKKYEIELFY